MAWTSPKTWLVGETVTAANMNFHVRDNEEWLRRLTGNADPPAADYVAVSTSTSLTAWAKITQAVMAANSVGTAQVIAGSLNGTHLAVASVGDSHMVNQKVNRVGDSMTGTLTAQKDITVADAMYATANVQLFSAGGGAVVAALGFHRSGIEGAAIYLLSGQMRFRRSDGVNGMFWGEWNDGPASTLNADLLDGNDASAFALAAHNHAGVYDVVGHTHAYLPTAGGTMAGVLTMGAAINAAGQTVTADRHAVGASEYVQAPAAGEIGLYAGNSPRYRQSSSLATFLTPGVYATSWTVSSDRRLKKDVQTLAGSLEMLRKLRPITYIPNAKGTDVGMVAGRRMPGFIAQEVAEVLPHLVSGDPFLGVDQVGMVPYIVASLADIDARLAALEAA